MVLGSSAGVGAGVDLKDAEEVKDYIENLSIEYRFGCYQEKNPSSCHLLADYWEGIKSDFHKALRTYEKNCNDYNFGHSCHKAGGYNYFGKGCEKNADKSYEFFKKGCDLGYHRSCFNAGLMHFADRKSKDYVPCSMAQDKKVGLELFRKSCDEGDIAEGCYRYGAEFIKGMQDVCTKNMETAFKYNLKACELGSFQGCTNVAVMYKKGDGVQKDMEAFEEYKAKATDMFEQLKGESDGVKFGVGAN